jgi:hypothetical protein
LLTKVARKRKKVRLRTTIIDTLNLAYLKNHHFLNIEMFNGNMFTEEI